MDMKKILQAMDGATTKAEVNSSGMKKFLQIVKEAELNQPAPTAPAAPASTLSPEQLAYNQLRAQLDGADAIRGGPSANTFAVVSPEVTASTNAMKQKLAQMAAALKAKGIDAAAEYDAPEPGESAAAPVDLNQKYATEEVGMSRFLSIMNEGKSPHKVALPVQMAMQHYQTPVKQAINETSSVFKTYVALVEDDISEKKIAKQQLIRQYSQRIAEAVLMKERVIGGEVTPPGINRLTGKPIEPQPAPSAPTDTSAVVPLGKRFDPRFKNGPEPYTIDIDGVVYKFAGRTATGPGTGEVIKVPAAVIGIRGLSAVSVELGKDGMYYPAPATNESAPSAGLSKAKKSATVKKAKAGKDIGKPGKGFDELAKKTNTKVAAAAMWKNIKR